MPSQPTTFTHLPGVLTAAMAALLALIFYGLYRFVTKLEFDALNVPVRTAS